MSAQNARSEHYFLRPIACSAAKTSKPSKRHRPPPIKTTGIRPSKIRNAEAYIENSKSSVSHSDSIVGSQLSPLTLALDTPHAIVTAIPWKLRSRTTSAAATPSSATSFSSESPGYQDSAFRLSPSPMEMESAALPSGRILKSPFSSVGSPCPYSPLLSVYESRLSPNPNRDLPRLNTNLTHRAGLSTPNSARKMRTPVLNRRTRQRHPQVTAKSSSLHSPVTPVTNEIEVPIILDPMTPPADYTLGTASSRLLPPSRDESSAPRPRALKRGRAPSSQNLREEVVASPRGTLGSRHAPQEDLVFLLPSSVYVPNQVAAATREAVRIETAVPSKRSRRQRDADLDGYERLMGRDWR